MIAIDLSKQQALDVDPRAIKQINFTANLDREENATMFFVIEKAKDTVLDFSQGTVKVLWMQFHCVQSNVNSLIFINVKMTQYNSLNVKLSDSQLNKLKSAIKNETKVVLRPSSNMIGDDETNFPHKLLLIDRQISHLRKAFVNYLSADFKLLKTQLSKMIQSGGFLGRLLGPLLKTGLPLIKM